MEEYKSKVYIKTDDSNRVIRLEGGYGMDNIDNVDEWILIDEGVGDKYNHCQSAYLEKPIRDMRGIPQYKYVDGEVVERTQEEMDADYVEPIPTPTQMDRIEAQTMYTALMTDTLIEEG